MKNILIVGPPRCGKTTLASMIVKEISCYSVINTDAIREGIYEAFFKSEDKDKRKNIVKQEFPKFINKLLEHYQNYYNPDLYYIIEGDLLSFEESLKMSEKYEIEIVCIGMPKMTPADLFKRIRDYSSKHGCWTNKLSDDELLKICKEFIEQSQREKQLAKENNLTYLDVSSNMNCLLEYVNRLKERRKLDDFK